MTLRKHFRPPTDRYIVAFRSTRRKDADADRLYQADRDAHEEAVTAGGLLLYWYGSVNRAGENLATCIWQSRRDAIAANRNPKHAIAARLASVSGGDWNVPAELDFEQSLKLIRPFFALPMPTQATYERYVLERHVLRKIKGQSGVRVEEWRGGDVGF